MEGLPWPHDTRPRHRGPRGVNGQQRALQGQGLAAPVADPADVGVCRTPTSVLPWAATFCMMNVMRKTAASARAVAKEASHQRIVQAAARAIRRSGYDGTGVADIMKEAGLTHGAFYAHFTSREAMLAEAADRAGAESNAFAASIVAAAPPEHSLRALMQAYLSEEHLAGVETGCPVSALGSEMPRQAPEVRRVCTRRIQDMIDLVARQSPDWGQPAAHERALVTVAAMVGALTMARAVDDPALSASLRQAVLNLCTPAGD